MGHDLHNRHLGNYRTLFPVPQYIHLIWHSFHLVVPALFESGYCRKMHIRQELPSDGSINRGVDAKVTCRVYCCTPARRLSFLLSALWGITKYGIFWC